MGDSAAFATRAVRLARDNTLAAAQLLTTEQRGARGEAAPTPERGCLSQGGGGESACGVAEVEPNKRADANPAEASEAPGGWDINDRGALAPRNHRPNGNP